MELKRCINAKSYNLTVRAEYATSEIAGAEGFLMVVNNNGVQVRYNANLFEAIETPIVAEPEAEPQLTEAEIIAAAMRTLLVEYEQSRIIVSLTVDGVDINIRIVISDNYAIGISCGIHQLSGLWNIANGLRSREQLAIGNLRTLITKEIILLIVEERIEESKFILLSTNTNMEGFDFINEALMQFSDTTSVGINPNSDNEIKLWVLDTELMI